MCTYLMVLVGMISANTEGRHHVLADLLGLIVPLRARAGRILAFTVVPGKGTIWYNRGIRSVFVVSEILRLSYLGAMIEVLMGCAGEKTYPVTKSRATDASGAESLIVIPFLLCLNMIGKAAENCFADEEP